MSKNSATGSKVSFSPDSRLLTELRESIVLIKYGGNAMVDNQAREAVFRQVHELVRYGLLPVIVHGGGPVIKELLEIAKVESVFIGGHRKTDREAMKYVEMALSGRVNGDIVKGLNTTGLRAVGLSGKDASMVRAVRRYHEAVVDGVLETSDLGFVGDVESIDTELVKILLKNRYLPVIAPIGVGKDGEDYNINADMFAGHMAGALKASAFVAMTDVDGLMEDPVNPDTRLVTVKRDQVEAEIGGSISGGMIPKVEACLIALGQGVKKAHIINGMKPNTLLNQLLTTRKDGTTIES
jgi:acetylglutamate kinase